MKSAVIIVALFLSLFTGISALANTSIFSGYGYGYGACSAITPTGLAEAYSTNYKHITFSWNAVSFNNCEHTTPVSYDLKIRLNNATVMQSFTDIASAEKTISASSLKSNHAYKFQVRAIASDGEHTSWTTYKLFRTLPAKPSHITVTPGIQSVVLRWENIARSKSLNYYRVSIRHQGHTVTSKRVTLGLHNNSTGITIKHLHSGRTYKVWIRGVAAGPTKGEYAKERFTTL